MTTTIIQQIIFDSLVISFFVLGIVAAVVGVGLAVCSGKMFRLFAFMNRYVSTRKSLKPMSVQRDIGPAVQRYRWWFGAVFIAGAAYSIYSLVANFDAAAIASTFVSTADSGTPYAFVLWVVEVLKWFMIVLSVIAFAVGIMLTFFPDALRGVEIHANRWYSFRKATIGVDNAHLTLDRWVETFPRAAGLAITLGALIVIVSSGVMLCESWPG